jgi:hypothetical protein
MPNFNLADYEPVEVRLARFWEEHPKGRVITDIVKADAGQFIVKAYLFREEEAEPMSTGYAEEVVTTRGVNQTSALENCETSAIGRALANAGYAPKGKRPSREEMTKVERASKPGIHAELKTRLAVTHPNPEDRKFFLEATVGRQLAGISELTETEVQNILNTLTSKETTNG